MAAVNTEKKKTIKNRILHLNDSLIIISPRVGLIKDSKFHSEILKDYDFFELKKRNYGLNKHSVVNKDLHSKVSEILIPFKLNKQIDNLCLIINDLDYRISLEKNSDDINQKIDWSRRINEEYEFGKFIAKFGNKEIDVLEIQFKSLNKGRSDNFSVKTKSFILSIMRAILSANNISDWDKYNSQWGDDYIPSTYKPDKEVDFTIYAYCLSLLLALEKAGKDISKYRRYYIVGRLFAVIGLLDDESAFNKKNHSLKYSYTSYYKYLTDNVKNIENRIPKLFIDTDKKSKK